MTGLGESLKGMTFKETITDLLVPDPNGNEVRSDRGGWRRYRKVSGQVTWEVVGGRASHGADCQIVEVEPGSDSYFKVGDVVWRNSCAIPGT